MNWSGAVAVLQETKAPEGYALLQLATGDVAPLVSCLREWYPDIVVGAESCHLSPAFYREHALLAGMTEDRPIFPIVAKRGNEIAAMITLERNTPARTLTCRMGVVAPAHRGPGLALLGPLLLEKIGRAIGAELAYYVATLKTRHQQVLAERLRYQLVGIVPAYDRAMVRPGDVKRVYEAIYAKVLVGEEAVVVPPDEALTVRTRVVWQALFGR